MRSVCWSTSSASKTYILFYKKELIYESKNFGQWRLDKRYCYRSFEEKNYATLAVLFSITIITFINLGRDLSFQVQRHLRAGCKEEKNNETDWLGPWCRTIQHTSFLTAFLILRSALDILWFFPIDFSLHCLQHRFPFNKQNKSFL